MTSDGATRSYGKKVQVSPETLVHAFSQTSITSYDNARAQVVGVTTMSKKLQVESEPLFIGNSQTYWVEPEPMVTKPHKPKPNVMPAPSVATNGRAKYPLPVTGTQHLSKRAQVAARSQHSKRVQTDFVMSDKEVQEETKGLSTGIQHAAVERSKREKVHYAGRSISSRLNCKEAQSALDEPQLASKRRSNERSPLGQWLPPRRASTTQGAPRRRENPKVRE